MSCLYINDTSRVNQRTLCAPSVTNPLRNALTLIDAGAQRLKMILRLVLGNHTCINDCDRDSTARTREFECDDDYFYPKIPRLMWPRVLHRRVSQPASEQRTANYLFILNVLPCARLVILQLHAACELNIDNAPHQQRFMIWW